MSDPPVRPSPPALTHSGRPAPARPYPTSELPVPAPTSTHRTAQEAPMDKLQPPTPAEEITPAEPIEQISDDDAVSVLPDLPQEKAQELEQRADAWVEQVAG